MSYHLYHAHQPVVHGRQPALKSPRLNGPQHEETAGSLWCEQRAALEAWADASEDGPFTTDELREWWFSETTPRGFLVTERERGRVRDFLALFRFDAEDDQFIRDELGEVELPRFSGQCFSRQRRLR